MGKIIYNGIDCGGGGGGASIEPNPSETATDTLEKLGINGTVYDFEGTTYTAGTNIQIVNDVISATDTTYTAGTNIQITNNEISATDTTYSAFQGTDGTEAGSSGLVPAPAASDTNKYLKSDGTWATVSGGGGSGNVDDVYVNGTSVLDSNHIAQVTSYKELTQAQYDALPASKLTDNILYCIKDVGIDEGDKFAPIIYSLDEREVGTWIDGKPLYQKTIVHDTALPFQQWERIDIGVNNAVIVNYDGKYHLGNYAFPFSDLNYHRGADASEYCCCCGYDAHTIQVFQSISGYTVTCIITVWYTKNDEVPGSGSWTTSGVPAVHYSTNEQVIGTWIDGKTIYQKAFNISQIIIRPAGTVISDISIANIDTLISGIGTLALTTPKQSSPLSVYPANNQLNASSNIAILVDTIILQYTKIID